MKFPLLLLALGITLLSKTYAKVLRSSDFGWKPNQDITYPFHDLLEDGTIKPGVEFVLEHKFKISKSHHLPDNFILSATKGAGLDVTDAKGHAQGRALLELGNGTILRNLTIHYLDTPPLGPTGETAKVNFTYRLGIQGRSKKGIRIENCRLIGSIGHHIRLLDCHEPQILGCHIAGGHWSVLLSGDILKPLFRNCLIEQCQGDAIKTGLRGAKGTRGALIENCVFQDNLRDGIDTTGGFKDSIVRNCIFRRLREGLDIKAFYEHPPHLSPDVQCSNVLIENCQFYDMPNGITLTTIDGGRRRGPGKELLNSKNIAQFAPHDIEVRNCVFGYSEFPLKTRRQGGYGADYPSFEKEHMRMFLIKDAYNIRYKGIRFANDRIKAVHTSSIGGSKHLSREAARAIQRSVEGNILDDLAPKPKPGQKSVPFHVGPK